MKAKPTVKRLGILTAGGDCPGINAVIRAAVKTALLDYRMEVVGFKDGFDGLVTNKYRKLEYEDVSGILTQGGTILGTSNTGNPFRWPRLGRGGKPNFIDASDRVLANFRKHKLDGLIVIGGDGTMHIALKLQKLGVPVVGVPKTIDNDLNATDYTFGFYTAVTTATEAIDKIHSTAESHHRVMVVELMGRYAGWLTLYAGVASGSDIILLPELPYRLEAVCEVAKERSRRGKRFSIVAVAEGAKERGGDLVVKRTISQSTDPVRLGGIGQVLGRDIENHADLDTRVMVLGHLQRGGTPCPFDRLLATKFGFNAALLAAQGKFGRMVSLKGDSIVDVPLAQAVKSLKTVPPDHPMILAARSLGTSFGTEDV